MIYARIDSPQHYDDLYPAVLACLQHRFQDLQTGHQGDAWIWIFEQGKKVAVDSFTSMQFEIKADQNVGPLLQDVIACLQTQFPVEVFADPEWEAHE